ncbi:hypothetical protein TRFO_01348 [Tritrichomonas foetus]|uniref:DUF3447 domain-containing protein n=1 Tax=Tritrichomonas foetus TaxID=1144522 RepID=A0A1J4K6V5_9EUKA|nr:hypothetical protein TRFO_01348 [Tritrichomonas foetus]|eukprot:OHT07201.1 hypothetical protein TRFO_01348 [Tritrichomonas foetus]
MEINFQPRCPIETKVLLINQGKEYEINKRIGVLCSKVIADFYKDEKNNSHPIFLNIDDKKLIFENIASYLSGKTITITPYNMEEIEYIAYILKIQNLLDAVEKLNNNIKKVAQFKEQYEIKMLLSIELLLFSINSDTNINEMTHNLLMILHFTEEKDFSIFFGFIFNLVRARVKYMDKILEMLSTLNHMLINNYKITTLMPNLRISIMKKLSLKGPIYDYKKEWGESIYTNEFFYFMYRLIEKKVILVDDILFNRSHYIYFAHLYLKNDTSSFDSMIKNMDNRIKDYHSHFKIVQNELPKHTYRNLHRHAMKGKNLDIFAQFIQEDNVNAVIEMCNSNENNSLKDIYFTYLYDTLSYKQNSTPLEYAAGHSAIKCFRFFLLNNFPYSEDFLPIFAVIGGNWEIIQLCKQKGCEFKDCLKYSIYYHRYEITDWIVSNYYDSIYPRMDSCIGFWNIHYFVDSLEYDCDLKYESLINESIIHDNILLLSFISNQLQSKSNLTIQERLLNNVSIETLKFSINHHLFDKTVLLPNVVQNGNLELFKCLEQQFERNDFEEIVSSLVCWNNVAMIKYFIKEYQHQYSEENVKKILIHAIQNRNIEIVKYFLKSEYLEDGELLYKAAYCNSLNIVKLLMESITIQNQFKSPFYDSIPIIVTAAHIGNRELIKYFVNHPNVDINKTTKDGISLITELIIKGRHDLIEYIWKNKKIHFNNYKYHTSPENHPLIAAVLRNDVKVIRLLVSHPDIDLNMVCWRGTYCGYSALHIACLKGFYDISTILLKNKKVKITNEKISGNSLLHLACISKNIHVISLILNLSKFDCTMQNKRGDTALHLALDLDIAIIKMLLDSKKMNVNLRNEQKYTPLDLAILKDDMDIVKLLIDSGEIDLSLEIENVGMIANGKSVFPMVNRLLSEYSNLKNEEIDNRI